VREEADGINKIRKNITIDRKEKSTFLGFGGDTKTYMYQHHHRLQRPSLPPSLCHERHMGLD